MNIDDTIRRIVKEELSLLLKDITLLYQQGKEPQRISFTDFCKEYNITRPTGYAWHERGLIKMEKIGGRNYVLVDSIKVKL